MILLSNFKTHFQLNLSPLFKPNSKHLQNRNNKSLHQRSLLLADNDFTSNDEEHIYSRIPKHNSTFIPNNTLNEETFSTIKKTKAH